MVSQSVEQWCAQTEKEQADTAEVQIIAAVKFEKVYEWLLGWLYGNQIAFSARKCFLKAKSWIKKRSTSMNVKIMSIPGRCMEKAETAFRTGRRSLKIRKKRISRIS